MSELTAYTYEEADEEPTEPEEGDYILTSYGSLGADTLAYEYMGGWRRVVRGSNQEDDAKRIIHARMDREQFWPNIWHQDDHGGFTLITT